jgi:predicted porin
MKKFLYATTALASVGMIAGAASDAAAAEKIKLGLSGYFQQWGVYSDQNINTTGNNAAGAGNKIKTNPVDQKHNSEICVIGETTLDNGLTVGINVQIEANTSGDNIDESYLYVQHPTYGQLIVGDENNAGYLLHVTAPDGGINVDSGDMINNEFWVNTFASDYFDTAIGTTNLRYNDNDSGKFTYITPRYFGFQAGASFIPEAEPQGGDNNSSAYYNNTAFGTSANNNTWHNGWAAGLNYTNKFGDLGVQASGGVMGASAGQTGKPAGVNGSNLFAWNTGLQLSYAGFSFGGAYANSPNKNAIGAGNGTASFQSTSYTVGAAYAWGPYKVGIDYMRGVAQGSLASSNDQRLDQGVISGQYTLGPGIRVVGGFFVYNGDAEDPNAGMGFNNNGWGFASGLKLSF